MNWKRMAAFGITALGLALGASGGGARADLITNGGFDGSTGQLGETTSITGWTAASTNYAFVFSPSTVTNPGSNGQDGYVALIGPGNPGGGTANGLGASPAGGNFLGADGDYQPGAVSQTITGLTVGQTYALGFYWAAAQQYGYSGATTSGWDVTLGGSTQSTGLVSPGAGSFSGWFATTMDFTATSTTEKLSFLAQATGGGALPPFSLLDGVTLNAVPEPSSALIVGLSLLAFGAFGAVKTRRRAASASV